MLTNFFTRQWRNDKQDQPRRRRRRIRPGARRVNARGDVARQSAELWLAPSSQVLEDRTLLSVIIADSSIADYEADPTITSNIRGALVSGLSEVANRLETLSENGDFNSTVPGVIQFNAFSTPQFSAVNLNTLLGDVDGTTLKNRFNSFVTDDLNDASLDGMSITEFDSHIDRTNSLILFTDQRVTVDIDNTSLADLGGGDYELTFDLLFQLRDSDSTTAGFFDGIHFDLGRNIDQFGIATPAGAFGTFNEINVEAGFVVQMTVGLEFSLAEGDFGVGDPTIDDTEVTVDENEFFIENGSLAGTAEAEANGISAGNARVGFLDVDFQVDDYDLDGRLEGGLNGGAKILKTNIGNANVTNITPSGTLVGEFTATVDGIADFADGFMGTYEFSFSGLPLGPTVAEIADSDDPRAAPGIVLNQDFIDDLLPFKNVDEGAIVALLDQIGQEINALPASEVLQLKIPFTDGQTVGDFFNFSEFVNNALLFDELNDADKLLDDEEDPRFISVQSLTDRLSDILPGLGNADIAPTFNPGANEFTLQVKFDAAIDLNTGMAGVQNTLDVPIGFDVDLGSIGGVSSDVTVTIEPNATIAFAFGVQFQTDETAIVEVAPRLISPILIAGLDNAGAVVTPLTGVLSGNADFRLTIGDLGAVSVKVLLNEVTDPLDPNVNNPSLTSDNNSIADLIADVQAAIDFAIMDRMVDADPDEAGIQPPVVEVGRTADGRLTLSSPDAAFLKIDLLNPGGPGEVVTRDELGFADDRITSNAPTPFNGILSGNAQFDLRVGDAAAVSVTVLQADTLTNGGSSDPINALVADVQAAVDAAVGGAGIVDVMRRGGSGDGIALRAVDASLLQIVNPNDVAIRDLGYEDAQISARRMLAGRDELLLEATSDAPGNGDPGGNVTFSLVLDGGDPIEVTVHHADPDGAAGPLTGTDDNMDNQDLVNDINRALSAMSLPDGRNLGGVVTAGAFDSNGDETRNRLFLRSTGGASNDLQIQGGGAATLGFANPGSAVRVGPPIGDPDVQGDEGNLSGAARFTITLDAEAPVSLTIPDNNRTTIAALVGDINTSINGSALAGQLVAGRFGNRIILAATNPMLQQIRLSLDDSTAQGGRARDELGFEDGQVARNDADIRFFVDNFVGDMGDEPLISLGFDADADEITASARFGFVGIDVAGGADPDALFSLTFSTQFGDRIFVADIGNSMLEAAATFTPADVDVAGATFDLTVGTNTPVPVSVADTAGNMTLDDLRADVQQAIDDALGVTEPADRMVRVRVENGAIVVAISALHAATIEIDNANAAAQNGLGIPNTGTLGTSAVTVPAVEWSGEVHLRNITVSPNLPGLTPAPFTVSYEIENGSPFGKATPDFSGVPGDLLNFADSTFSDLIAALSGISDLLNDKFEDFDFLGSKLPVINRSLNDLLTVPAKLQQVVDDFANNPTAIVQDLGQRLAEAFSLPGDVVTVEYNAAEETLELQFMLEESFNRLFGVDFDLSDLTGDLPDGLNLQGAANLQAAGGAELNIGLGIDLSDATAPSAFIDLNRTDLAAKFAARGTDLNFIGALGPLGLFVKDGQIAIDGDGDATTNDFVMFEIELVDPDDSGKIVILTDLTDPDSGSELGDTDADVTLTGALDATLPIFFPTESNFLGNVAFTVADLAAFLPDPTNPLNFDFELPDISDFLANFEFNLLDNLRLMTDGLDLLLGNVQDFVGTTFYEVKLPLIGDALDDAAQFIDAFRSDVLGSLRNVLDNAAGQTQQQITDALNAALFDVFNGLGILQDGPDEGSDVTVDDLGFNSMLTGDIEDHFLQWDMTLGEMIPFAVPFDLGIPAIGLNSAEDLTLDLIWSFDLAFGLNFQDGFFYEFNQDEMDPEIEVQALVTLPQVGDETVPDIIASLVFLRVELEDNKTGTGEDLASLNVNFDVNLSESSPDDPDDGSKLTLTELGELDAEVKLTGGADIDVRLRAAIGGAGPDGAALALLPSVVTDFELLWTFDVINPSGIEDDGLTKLKFTDVALDLGSLFSDFIGPIAENIQTFTKPIQPIIDVLTTPIPVISDLAGEPFTLVDVAALFGDFDPDLIEDIAEIITFINNIPTQFDNVLLPLAAEIDLLAAAGMGPYLNLFEEDGFAELRDPKKSLLDFDGIEEAINGFDFAGAVDALGINSADAGFLKGLDSKDESLDFIDFPIFNDPFNSAIGLLFGRNVTFVTVDPGPFKLAFEYSQFFPIIGPLGASITGSIGVTIDFAFGYDSEGLVKFAQGGFKHPLDVFRGFYISDTANADGTGADVNEIELTGGLAGAAELNLGVAKGSVGGGVFLTVGFDLVDPDNDGKVHIEELLNNIVLAENPLGIFDINLLIEAKLLWAIEVLFVFSASGQIGPSLPILEQTFSFDKEPLTATEVSGGVLRLNMGPFAEDRLYKDTVDGNETFTVTQTGNGTVTVSGQGGSQEYSGVTSIEAMAGAGNDSITFITMGDFAPIPVEVDGGFGDDTIDLSDWVGAATVHGGSGNDTIHGGAANDQLFGEKGLDFVTGGGGADLVDGGDDNDFLSGDSGTPGMDTILGGAGNDLIGGGAESDYIDGGTGTDIIRGDSSVTESMPGVFTIVAPAGTEGDDTISAGLGADDVRGEGGDDLIGGGAGSDTLRGNDGNDTIWGDSSFDVDANRTPALPNDEGHDQIFGNDGEDTIFGEGGNDLIRGNADNDIVEGGFGGDTIFGDAGDDLLLGQSDSDIVFGGADNDTIRGGTGDDILFGDDGLVARLGDNAASTADDDAVGDGSINLTLGFAGDGDPLSRDLMITEVDSMTDGDDSIFGDAGRDTAFGGAGNDTILGDFDPNDAPNPPPAEPDVLIGDGGLVELANRRLKTIQTIPGAEPGEGEEPEVGNDTISGQGGSDFLFGGGANDTLFGRFQGNGPEEAAEIRDDDVIVGDDGKILFESLTIGDAPRPTTFIKEISTDTSTDAVATGGDDTLFGNKHNDTMFGGVADDEMHGNTGTDVALGDNGRILFQEGMIHFIETTDTTQGTGGMDTVTGNEANDTLIGGVASDEIKGNTGDDIALGDNAEIDYLFDGDMDVTTIDLVRTKDFQLGGDQDTISGNEGSDTLMGGDAGDEIYGDTDFDKNSILGANGGTDVAIGDQGQVLYATAEVDGENQNLITLIETTDSVETDGGVDTIFGNDFNDTILGGVAGDILHGESQLPVADSLKDMTGDDVIVGDEGRLRYDIDADPTTLDLIQTFKTNELGGNDSIFGNDGADTAMGGSHDDLIYGDFYTANAGTTFAKANDPGTDVLIGDGGEVTYDNAVLTRIRTIEPAMGGMDTIAGNDFDDTILGGFSDDRLLGEAEADELNLAENRAGNDIVLGDNGELNYVLLTDTIEGRPDVEEHLEGTTVELDGDEADPATLDIITTTDPIHGGNDTIFGNAGQDTLFGGTLEDAIWGDTDDAANGTGPDGPDGSDLMAGDHMKLYPSLAAADPFFANNDFFAIDTREQDGAGNDTVPGNDFDDTMFGNAADDTMLGQQGDDVMFGGTGNDDMVGGQNIQSFSPTAKDDLDPMSPADVAAINAASLADLNPLDNRTNDLNDVIDGGAGFDLIAGDNAMVIHGAGPFGGAFSTNQRFRNVAADGLAYHLVTVILQVDMVSVDIGFEANVTADLNADPGGFGERVVVLWDHSRQTELDAAGSPNDPRPFGNDVIAGGSEDDVIFGQLGDDIVQGDGGIELAADADNTPESFQIPGTDLFGAALHYNVTEQTSDGNDYAEGNGGNDILIGNLGQDDLLGGNSDLFGLINGVFGQNHPVDRIARPDGADQIFGGAGNPDRLARNDYVGASDSHSTGPTNDDPIIPLAERHARDADFIFGDNARAFRLVNADGYVGYNYDLSGQIIARTATPVDYAYSIEDVLPQAIPSFEGIGAGDLVMGESGDDTIHGMTGDDVLFGNSDDDDVYGEIGHDWISGGTGQDGILGDDGLLLTSRNTEKANNNDDAPAEPLYGVAKLDEVDEVIETPGNIHLALIHVDGALKKTADLITFDLRPDTTELAANDILFGGLDDDFIHAGAGSDAVSGAEALPEFYAGGTAVNEFLQAAQQIAPIQASEVDPPVPPPLTPEPFWFDVAPYNPGDTLRFEGNGKPAEFFLYNEFEPRRKILLSDLGEVIEFSTDGVSSVVTTLEAVFGGSLIIPANVELQVVVQTGKPKDAVVTDVTIPIGGPFGDQAALLAHIQTAMDAALGAGVVEAAVDEDGDLTLLLVGAHGQQQVFLRKVVAPADVHDFLLNFDETEGIVDMRFIDAEEGPGAKSSDGDDVIFGDLGNDWIVGGTGRDHAYGGRDEDLINADDNHDSTEATAGEPGLKQNDPPVDALDNNIPDPFQAYADYAYGGAGRDVLILNTGADRMVDWVGEFNSYIAPFAPFGAFHISRSLSPHLREFLYDLSEADGADQTVPDAARFAAHKNADVRIDDPDPDRNGEPYGEMGLILQQDEGWQDQTGGPADPQAGNIPGGPREIMRRELFSDGGAPVAFAAAGGNWTVQSGQFTADPVLVGAEAVSLYHLNEWQPNYFEILVTASAEKDKAGVTSNAYAIFDYQDEFNFKFAGFDAGVDKLRIGRRTADGWIVDVQSNMQLRANTEYDLFVSINGTTLTLLVGASQLSYNFGTPLNEGYVGLATDNSVTHFDDWQVQKLPPDWAAAIEDDFSDGVADPFLARTGDWQVNAGRYVATAVANEVALTTSPILVDHLARVEFHVTLAGDDLSGIVFDYYGPEEFKFAAVSAVTNEVLIGHRTNRGWFVDNAVARTINAGEDYRLTVSLAGSTVSVLIDGEAAVGHVFNAILNDGQMGLIARGGGSSFDDVLIRSNDADMAIAPAGGEALLFDGQPVVGTTTAGLTHAAVQPVLTRAVAQWTATGVDSDLLRRLNQVDVHIVNLPGSLLGYQSGLATIWLDQNAAGFGWWDGLSGSANTGVDLLSVVSHELGHILGFDHDVLPSSLGIGDRELPLSTLESATSIGDSSSGETSSAAFALTDFGGRSFSLFDGLTHDVIPSLIPATLDFHRPGSLTLNRPGKTDDDFWTAKPFSDEETPNAAAMDSLFAEFEDHLADELIASTLQAAPAN